MRPAKLRGFRGAVQSGDETVGETTAGKNVFEEPVSPYFIEQVVALIGLADTRNHLTHKTILMTRSRQFDAARFSKLVCVRARG